LKSPTVAAVFVLAAPLLWASIALGDGSGDPTAVKNADGKYSDKDGNPTYGIKPDGTVDWYTYSGYGPNGDGSSYAPALKDSLQTTSYSDFLSLVAGGRKNVNTANENVMPAFGDNKNVMCVIDDIFVYLRARANDALDRVRPAKHEDKPEAAKKWTDSCFGQGG
jgi:methanol metabolism-related c-type cytochrome